MARHEPDATRNVVPELRENERAGAQRVHRVAPHGAPEQRPVFDGCAGAAILAEARKRLPISTRAACPSEASFAADGWPYGATLRTQRGRGSKCFLPPPATTEAKLSRECVFFFVFGLPGDTYDDLAFTRILATASPSIGGIPQRFSLQGFRRTFGRANCKRLRRPFA